MLPGEVLKGNGKMQSTRNENTNRNPTRCAKLQPPAPDSDATTARASSGAPEAYDDAVMPIHLSMWKRKRPGWTRLRTGLYAKFLRDPVLWSVPLRSG